MKQKGLQFYKGLLEKELDRAQKTLDMTEENNFNDSLRGSTGELSFYDNHPADHGSETYEFEKNFALQGHQVQQIHQIKHALEKIENGEYGKCDLCGKEIDQERLEAIPEANLCIDCEETKKVRVVELEHDRSVEEDALMPPFGRTFNDNSGKNYYDGEDAWQDVAKYGTSDTPQDISVNRAISYQSLFQDSKEDPGFDIDDVEKVSNRQYRDQLPDGHVEEILDEEEIDYDGDAE